MDETKKAGGCGCTDQGACGVGAPAGEKPEKHGRLHEMHEHLAERHEEHKEERAEAREHREAERELHREHREEERAEHREHRAEEREQHRVDRDERRLAADRYDEEMLEADIARSGHVKVD